jgi:hypothetical protein
MALYPLAARGPTMRMQEVTARAMSSKSSWIAAGKIQGLLEGIVKRREKFRGPGGLSNLGAPPNDARCEGTRCEHRPAGSRRLDASYGKEAAPSPGPRYAAPGYTVASAASWYPSRLDNSSAASLTAWIRSSMTFLSVMRIAGPEIDSAATTLPV